MRSRRCGIAASAVTFVLAADAFAADPVAPNAAAPGAPAASPSSTEPASPSTEPASSTTRVAQAPAPSSAPPAPPSQRDDSTAAQPPAGSAAAPVSADKPSSKQPVLRFIRPNRMWGITGGFETHAVLVQTEPNDTRSRPEKLYNWFFITPGFFPSQYDAIRANFGVNQHFTADAGESGFRWTDFVLRYTRSIPVGTEEGISPTTAPLKGVLFDAEASVTAPASFRSQNRGIITVPRARLYATKAFLDRSLVVSASGFGEHYVNKYRTAAGGSPNPVWRTAAQLAADYWMPFHKPLSIGAVLDTSWIWYHDVDTSGAQFGTSAPQQGQPTRQNYGAEVHAGYVFQIGDVNSAVQVAYALGDNTVLHDGVQHLYFTYYRRASEVYATFVARY